MYRIFNFAHMTHCVFFTCIFNQHKNRQMYMREIEMKIEFNLISVWS